MTAGPDLPVVLVAVALPFTAVALVPTAYRLLGTQTGYLGAAVAAACFALLATQYGATGTVGLEWVPSLGIGLRFRVDGWGLLFALLASGIGVLVFTYSAGYLHGGRELVRYYGALLAFMGSILGVALAADLVALFLFWELTSVASFVLIGYHDDDPESRYAARMAMFVTVGGGLFLLVALLLLWQASGAAFGSPTLSLTAMLENADAMRAALRERGAFVPVLALVAVGAGSKSAQVPLHFWLPNAMAAPTPVSAFLHSATMVKVGVYFLGRVRPLLSSPEWTLLFATVGLVTMTVTAVLAVAATDVKELLAYSTASHLGLMVAAFGFTTAYGAAGGTFHLLNHAAFKAALFLVAGIVAHEAGTRRINDLGGLWRDLPITAAITAVAALGMAGIPFFNGFYSKELVFAAAYEAASELGGLAWAFPVLATLASVFTVLYSLRFLAMFVGEKPTALGEVHRPPLAMLVPPAVLAVVAGTIGIAPEIAVGPVIEPAIAAVGGGPGDPHYVVPTELSPAVAMTAVAIGGGAAAYPSYDRLHRGIRGAVAGAPPARANWWYDRALDGVDRLGAASVPRIQNGLLRTYVGWFVGPACGLALLGYAATGLALPAVDLISVSPTVLLVLLVAVIAAGTATTGPSHVTGVLLLSVLGFMLAIFYILASAPDLALTQLVVETLTLVIFLLVIEELPAYYREVEESIAVRDVVLSLGVGTTVFVTVLLTAGRTESALAGYFTEQAIPEGGGHNVVNVILTDFRAFDTLGESAVIIVAAIAILTLVLTRDRGESP
ncbi:hydrogen gas-evolving membrane-bound hydrogenase subunit E [Halomicrobium urmianum]|uniref:hydrogen gas-evolving membrane-bound hydrogenase subunit E n=1 Tax=Halomicrobium urmianum TaxID=1586233 RepID=UPI001CD9E247|nr:hydrogen gas-evolving membrane-bound hydrogenase subunit E [Halomicrobium urmianum]